MSPRTFISLFSIAPLRPFNLFRIGLTYAMAGSTSFLMAASLMPFRPSPTLTSPVLKPLPIFRRPVTASLPNFLVLSTTDPPNFFARSSCLWKKFGFAGPAGFGFALPRGASGPFSFGGLMPAIPLMILQMNFSDPTGFNRNAIDPMAGRPFNRSPKPVISVPTSPFLTPLMILPMPPAAEPIPSSAQVVQLITKLPMGLRTQL